MTSRETITRPRRAGVSGMAVYVPRLRVRLEDWCHWTDTPWPKIEAIVGRSFRMRGGHESLYTMAANAVLRLIQQYDLDPGEVGMLALGTESSTDNAAGAVIVKGMVDRALREMGLPALSRSCEVPEFKHACLGGIYAMKHAARYTMADGRGRKAIVVCGDVAEYERGSTGEQTQGAGTVAMLIENEPKLFAIDLDNCGSAADYRGADFRKPMVRHFMDGYHKLNGYERDVPFVHDFPVFNGRYSTYCYIDEVVRASGDMLDRMGVNARSLYDSVDAILFHRPYHAMPLQAMAAVYLWGLGRDESEHPRLREICAEAGVDADKVLEEMRHETDLYDHYMEQRSSEDPYPHTAAVTKHFRKSAWFKNFAAEKMSLGGESVRELGNLYTASLPAWIATALDEAVHASSDVGAGHFLLVGYGSGDAAEAMPVELVPGWQAAAKRIQIREALANPVDLERHQYEALHDGRDVTDLTCEPQGEFIVAKVGRTYRPDFQDIGLEYYRYVR